jgi:hypothetical protein
MVHWSILSPGQLCFSLKEASGVASVFLQTKELSRESYLPFSFEENYKFEAVDATTELVGPSKQIIQTFEQKQAHFAENERF